MEVKVAEDYNLLLAHPTGVLNMRMAEDIMHFVEVWEVARQEGFDRFCDLTRLDAIQLSVSEVRQLALRRRMFNPNNIPVKSAFLADSPLAFGIVAMYEHLLESTRITVRAFRSLADASGWLRIEPRILQD